MNVKWLLLISVQDVSSKFDSLYFPSQLPHIQESLKRGQLNSQYTHVYHCHHPKNESIHAKCIPVRVDPRAVKIFDN